MFGLYYTLGKNMGSIIVIGASSCVVKVGLAPGEIGVGKSLVGERCDKEQADAAYPCKNMFSASDSSQNITPWAFVGELIR